MAEMHLTLALRRRAVALLLEASGTGEFSRVVWLSECREFVIWATRSGAGVVDVGSSSWEDEGNVSDVEGVASSSWEDEGNVSDVEGVASSSWEDEGNDSDVDCCSVMLVLEWGGVSLIDRSFEEVCAIMDRTGDTVELLVEHATDLRMCDLLDDPIPPPTTVITGRKPSEANISALHIEPDNDKAPSSPTRRKLPKTPV
ncbi:unnamed protein product [Diabrotica balteata]|uniref:Uncharacterized protein n=1 Tax=Diabrotica balteata TaxID=107213 RepID=A0A9N9XCK9_DIABA|nr:unnamed protein product [Diabrotica balteata]